jgi:hypothetical protein
LQAVKNLELKVNNECEALGLPPHAPLVGPKSCTASKSIRLQRNLRVRPYGLDISNGVNVVTPFHHLSGTATFTARSVQGPLRHLKSMH